MLKCEALVDAMEKRFTGSYMEFEEKIIKYVEDYMTDLCQKRNYFPICSVQENLPYIGLAKGNDKIIFNKEVIKELMNGNKLFLIFLFHELSHIQQNIQIETGVATPNIICYIKDTLLNKYQQIENKQFYGYVENKTYSYYTINYENHSKEIDAELNAILLTIEFFQENNIDLPNETKYLKDYFDALVKRKNKKRNLTYCGTFNSYYLTLDEAFDVAIKYHPEWLEEYPQLKVEYKLEDGVIQKKSEITYQEYNINSDLYHKVKYLHKNCVL